MSVTKSLITSALALFLYGCDPHALDGSDSEYATSVSELTALNGLIFNNLSSNGITVNGIALNSLSINEISLNSLSINSLSINSIKMYGNPLTTEQITNFKKVFQYMVQCALPAGASVTIPDENGQPSTYTGALGIEPTWNTTPLSTAGQWRITSCLMARTNATGQQVRLSVRGLGMTATSLEQAQYNGVEGAFWGNIFSATPAMYACSGDNTVLENTKLNPGRLCTKDVSTCGFSIVGKCTSICTRKVNGFSGLYQGCSSNTSCPENQPCTPDIEISTFLKSGIMLNGLRAASLQQQRGALANQLRVPFAASLQLASSQSGKDVLRYAVQCAFGSAESVQVGDVRLNGGFALAPQWQQRALSAHEQQRMSSCILAHVNQFGARVPISLDVPSLPSASPASSSDYRDGAFFGDLGTNSLFSCKMNEGMAASPHSSLRVCDEPGNTCGIQSLGACESNCDFENGRLKACRAPNGKTYSQLVEVRLPALLPSAQP